MPANAYPTDLREVYGSAEAWEHLYASRLYIERTLPKVQTEGIDHARRCLRAGHQAMAAFGEVQFPPTEDQLATLDTLISYNVTELPESWRISRTLDWLNAERKGTDEDFVLGEEYVGNRLRTLPPPPAVTRAIGERSLFSSDLWLANRTRIEVFRYVVGEQRPEVTLGPTPDEDWAQHARSVITTSVHDQQLSEIMVSELPVMTAAQYGHTRVLDRVGPPPPVHPENSLEWLKAAANCCQEINPPELGLVIDR